MLAKRTRIRRLLGLLLVFGLVAAACGGEADTSAADAAADAARQQAAEAQAEAEAAEAQAEARAAEAAQAAADLAQAQSDLDEARSEAAAAMEGDEAAQAELASALAQAEAALAAAEETAEAAEEAAAAAEEALVQATTTTTQPDPMIALLDEVVVSTPSLVAQADYGRAPYVAPAQMAGLLAFGGYLYRYLGDGTYVPDLAEDFPTYSEDGTAMTIKLKPNLVYSDGTPIVAQDAVVTLERAKEGPFGGNLAALESAEAVDDLTIVYQLSSPFRCFAQKVVCGENMPLHPHEQVLADPVAYFEKPVSASQYVVAEWFPGSPTMTLEANPRYHGGQPAIRRLILSSATDPISRLLQVSTGAAQVGFDIPVAVRADLPDDVNQIIHPIGGVFWIAIRTDSPGALSDVRVRKALCHAIDREQISERAFLGTAEPVGGVLPRSRTEWEYEDVIPLERNLDEARRLLAEAGYADGFSLVLQTWGARPGWTDAATVVSEQWADVGVTAEVQPVEDAVAIQSLINRDYEAQWVGGGGDNLTILTFIFYPDNFWSNSVAFEDADVTRMIDELSTAMSSGDMAESQRLQTAIQLRAWEAGGNYCPVGERTVLVGSRLPLDILQVIPASQNLWVAAAG